MSYCDTASAKSIGGNENFSRVKNTDCSITCLSQVDRQRLSQLLTSVVSYPVSQVILLPDPAGGTETLDFTLDQWIQTGSPSGQILNASQITVGGGGITVNLGVDTAQNAARYMALFGLEHVGDSVTLSFPLSVPRDGGAAATPVNLANSSTAPSFDHVQVALLGADPPANTQVMRVDLENTFEKTLVQVWAVNVTPGSEIIRFNVLAQGE